MSDEPYEVEIPIDLHRLWQTCEQDLLDTMPDHVLERIESDAVDAHKSDREHYAALRRVR